jgi:hypothetical protein
MARGDVWQSFGGRFREGVWGQGGGRWGAGAEQQADYHEMADDYVNTPNPFDNPGIAGTETQRHREHRVLRIEEFLTSLRPPIYFQAALKQAPTIGRATRKSDHRSLCALRASVFRNFGHPLGTASPESPGPLGSPGDTQFHPLVSPLGTHNFICKPGGS